MANYAMWTLVAMTIVITVIVIVVVRNTVVSARRENEIEINGKEALALIVSAKQNVNQNSEGFLSLQLTVEFNIENKKIETQKNVLIKIFDAGNYRAGNYIAIRYKANHPEYIVLKKPGK